MVPERPHTAARCADPADNLGAFRGIQIEVKSVRFPSRRNPAHDEWKRPNAQQRIRNVRAKRFFGKIACERKYQGDVRLYDSKQRIILFPYRLDPMYLFKIREDHDAP
jgi:hypothetical protein